MTPHVLSSFNLSSAHAARRSRCVRRVPCFPPRRVARGPLQCRASSEPGVDAWISRWKQRRETGAPRPSPAPVQVLGADPRSAYRYLFVGGWSAEAHGFTALILRDALEPRGVHLHAAHCAPSPWTLSAALAQLEAAVEELPGNQPLRLIGASVGGLLCALYAERHPSAVDSLFLMAPTFDLATCFERAVGGEGGVSAWRRLGEATLDGARLPFEALDDARAYAALPFVRCRAYVAQGTDDAFADAETALAWVRAASVNMRPLGAPSDTVPERRLLELDDDHSLASSVPSLAAKVVEWHGLGSLEPGAPALGVDLEGRSPADYARSHGINFEVYRAWLESQGIDPEDLK